ncbi:hypothetical protein M0813_02055 [Anaeramoeba flamelloides]|uniref:Uncharacterized protein n=1 Tax=Anaeramoeba flamelloides TaxID=1746091 RepID=A0ABQ8YQB3_9EUKA|nr:hypothetical protein M0813_02055 [Anaeramoeba flamelloides]
MKCSRNTFGCFFLTTPTGQADVPHPINYIKQKNPDNGLAILLNSRNTTTTTTNNNNNKNNNNDNININNINNNNINIINENIKENQLFNNKNKEISFEKTPNLNIENSLNEENNNEGSSSIGQMEEIQFIKIKIKKIL